MNTLGRTQSLALCVALALCAATAATNAPVDAGPAPGAVAARVGGRGCVPPVADARSMVVTTPFDPPAQRWLAGHRGVDLAAPVAAAIAAPCGGTVTYVGTVVDRGVVVIRHPDGLRSSVEPVTGTVGVGAVVRPGQQVGVLQDVPGHCEPASCLHWGVRRGETYLDPLALLGLAEPIVLLPA